jgi:O-antigen/teichoic acid export membrane protein
MGIMAPIYGVLISNSFSFLFLLFKFSNLLRFNIEKKTLIIFLKFGIQASAAGLFFYVIDWVDRIIIKDLLSLNEVGIYSLGYRIGAVINIILILPFSLIWAPIRMEYSKNSNASNFTTKIISYYSIVGIFFILMTILYNNEIINLFFKNKNFSNASNVFPLIMLSLQVYGLQGIIDYGIYIQKKVYLYIVISIIGIIINISFNYLLIPKFGYIAAAFVTLGTYILTTGITYVLSNKLHPIKIEWYRVILPFIYLLVTYSIIYNYSISLPIKISINLVSVIIFYFFWLSEEEKYLINDKTKNFLKVF